MKLSLMFVIGVAAVLTEKFYTANTQLADIQGFLANNHMANPSNTVLFGGQISLTELQELHDKAKSISHLKGPAIIGHRDHPEPEYRRSLMRKLRLKTKSLALRKVITVFQNSSYESILPNLEILEYLVHEYDTAIDFMTIGGMELLVELIQWPDKTIASLALTVLSAAMQGNPTVQAIASENHVLEILLFNLASEDHLPNILYAVSSFLRRMPDSQMKFCEHDGIALLVDIMQNHNNPLKFRIHAIDILADISFELFEETHLADVPFTNHKLMQVFTHGITATDACKEVALLLECEEYYTVRDKYYVHEKIIDAMNDLQVVCSYIFERSQVQRSIEKLINLYYPSVAWYINVDQQSRSLIFQDLMKFYEKSYHKRYTLTKDEL